MAQIRSKSSQSIVFSILSEAWKRGCTLAEVRVSSSDSSYAILNWRISCSDAESYDFLYLNMYMHL